MTLVTAHRMRASHPFSFRSNSNTTNLNKPIKRYNIIWPNASYSSLWNAPFNSSDFLHILFRAFFYDRRIQLRSVSRTFFGFYDHYYTYWCVSRILYETVTRLERRCLASIDRKRLIVQLNNVKKNEKKKNINGRRIIVRLFQIFYGFITRAFDSV